VTRASEIRRRRPEWGAVEIGASIPAHSRTRTVSAPPEQVWALLARFDRIVEWAPAVVHSEALTTPSSGVGAARRAQVGRLTLVETVTDWDEGSTLAYTMEGLPPFVNRAVNRWDLEPAGPERTTITLTVDVTPGPRPPMRLAAALAARVIDGGNAKLLDGLATAIARTDSQGSPA
jgi:carbon monoxide dehydrogenase subunit G